MLKIKKVVVGISGGVDSAVAAVLLKNKGYDVHGVFMQNWDIADEQGYCTADREFKDAALVCDKLKIGLTRVNYVKEYWNEVFLNLLKDYQNGCTPNPDVLCNKYVKFNHFYHQAINNWGADAIATGHYARTSFGPYLESYEPNEKVRLLQAADVVKDQTFFLCQVEQVSLRKTLFPLGDLTKTEVKHIAIENGLGKIALKKESMGICFIGSRNFQDFISEYVDNKPGQFVDIDTNEVVGEHKGIHQWTLGQRSRIPGIPEAYFIARKDVDSNTIFVAMGTKHPILYSKTLFTSKPHWINSKPLDLKKNGVFKCQFKYQHTYDPVDCEVCETVKGLVVNLKYAQRALTEGQFGVFYKNNECLGSARIVSTGPSNFTLNWLKNNGITNDSNISNKYKNDTPNTIKEKTRISNTIINSSNTEICNVKEKMINC